MVKKEQKQQWQSGILHNNYKFLCYKNRSHKYNTHTHLFNGPFSGTTRVSR